MARRLHAKRAESKRKTKRSPKRKVAARGKSARSAPKKRAVRKSTGKTRNRTTEEGMRLALKMKQAAEQTAPYRPDSTPHSPSPALSEHKPSPVLNNPHEQGETANIEQNTTWRGRSR